MSVDPRGAHDAVAVKRTVTLRKVSDGHAIGLPADCETNLDRDTPLARAVRGDLDREQLDVRLTVMRDGRAFVDFVEQDDNGDN